MKKFLLSIICALLPIFASAQEPYAVLSDNNTVLTFYYDDQKTARGGMDLPPYSSDTKSYITTVVFDPSFASCTSITNTSGWFMDSYQLTSINGLEYLNTDNVTNMSSMFQSCTRLTSFDLSHFNTSNVTDMSSMFSGCESLASLDVSGFNTSNVTDMTGMFGGLNSLQNLDVTNFDTEKVTNMGGMFGVPKLTSLDLSSFNTSNVAVMQYMFSQCEKLKTIYVSDKWSTASLENNGGGNMFSLCPNLVGGRGTVFNNSQVDETYAHIDGGESNPGYLTDINGEACEATWAELQSTIEYGEDVLSRARASGNVDQWMLEELEMFLQQGSEMYKEHTALEKEVRNMIEDLTWRIQEVEEAMKGGGGEEPYAVLSENNTVLTFYYDDQKTARGGMDVGPFSWDSDNDKTNSGWDEQREVIERVVFDESFANCTTITSTRFWFYEFRTLTTITGLDNLKTDNVTDMAFMFFSCSGLTSLDVSGFNTENVSNMTSMFSDCSDLTSLDVSGFNTKEVTDMSNMFYLCSSLTSLDVSGFNTENVTKMSAMFVGCSGLTSLDVSGFNTENVTDMSYMFNRCSGLTSLNVSGFNTAKVTKMEGMFMECYSLKSLDLSGFNTSNVTAIPYMFLGCTALTTIYVSSDWTTDNVEEGNEMFGQCTALVGGAGTKYDENHVDKTYAHIDGGTSNPGYLTSINGRSEAYFQNYTAYVYGNATLDDAFAEIGRETAIQSIAAIVWDADNALTADMLSGINNPNLLVFVTEASKAPAGVQNVVINGVAEEIILTDATGNNNFYCPQSFTARSISYSRDFSQTTEIEVCRGWETIALPFDVQSITHESHGALVPFAGGNSGYHFWLRQLSENGLMSAAQIEANKPYLISMPNNSIYPSVYNQNGKVTFSASDVTVPETTPQSDSYAGVTLYATFQQVAQGSSVYALNVGEARGEYPEGSVFEQSYRDIRPFQAYTTHTAGTRGIITLESLGGNDNTTGIEEIRMNSELRDSNGPWYSLDGRRLDAEPTKKGIYVKDGRKFVIK